MRPTALTIASMTERGAALPSYEQAASAVASHCALVLSQKRRTSVPVSLPEALGRVLAAPLIADRDQPPFDRSTRDGFACRASDLNSSALDRLRITGIIRAGESYEQPVAAGEAVEIMTGAPLPSGADTVVMLEHAEREGNLLRLRPGRRAQRGENIVARGREAQEGSVLLDAGVRLAPRHLGLAAAAGAVNLPVTPRPRVAILPTGDELVEIHETPGPNQIRNSNSYSLTAQVALAGGIPVRLPIVRDEREALEAALQSAAGTDLLLISGGVSAGKFDLVEEALASMGAEFFLTGARIQPGKPIVFGRLPGEDGGRYFFGLPGNPLSTLVTFALFVHPLLNALEGDRESAPRFVLARLTSGLQVKPGLTRFLPARIEAHGIEAAVSLVQWQGSGDLASGVRSNGYLVVPDVREQFSEGETVSVLLA